MPTPVPEAPNRDSTPELFHDSAAMAQQSFSTWMEIELHLKDAKQRIKAIRAMITNFTLDPR